MDRVVQEEHTSRRPTPPLRDRPVRAPYGPRVGTHPKYSVDVVTPGPNSSADGSSSPISTPSSPTLDSGHTPAREVPPASIDLPPITPRLVDVAIQIPSSPPSPLPDSSPRNLPAQSATGPKTFVGSFLVPPPLPPPPVVTFESVPIPWKGLSLEAAQWTFTSSELQEIVSRAIRLSAGESFIRLLSLQVLDTDIMEAEKRLESQRLAAQAKWRFEVTRRTMLMQALNSTVATLSNGGECDKDNTLGSLITQLATSVACCDTQMTTILQAMDQQIQLSSLQNRHWSSALSVALRKLNKACERQAGELKRALTRIRDLEDELEEAWKEAETLATELDDQRAADKIKQERRATFNKLAKKADTDNELKEINDTGSASPENNVTDSESGGNNDTDHESGKNDTSRELEKNDTGRELEKNDTGRELEKNDTDDESDGGTDQSDVDDTRALEDPTVTTDMGQVVGVTATAVASKAVLLSPTIPSISNTDSKSIMSIKSGKSTHSKTSDAQSRLSRVSAARMRSRTLSNASLRLPKSLRTPSGANPSANQPPVPALPDNLHGHSFLDMGNVSNEFVRPMRKWLPKRHPAPKSVLPDPPPSDVTTSISRSLPIRAISPASQPQSTSLPVNIRSYHKTRSNLVTSFSNSDPGPCSPVFIYDRPEVGLERSGSARGRLIHHDEGARSFVSRASSVLRRLSQATSSKHYSGSILPAYKVKEGDEEGSFLPAAD
ncbi:hypothetical protein EDD17DRAFT_1506507 [Pisolithus thermaeus]|nr:hypothetical protein EV401DRAFT_2066292 [Pisolithus croceorrhizus]KAI6164517.1 hypothetical protein EDD17DRAFT_1506507 [Pisolithus thermaeus]